MPGGVAMSSSSSKDLNAVLQAEPWTAASTRSNVNHRVLSASVSSAGGSRLRKNSAARLREEMASSSVRVLEGAGVGNWVLVASEPRLISSSSLSSSFSSWRCDCGVQTLHGAARGNSKDLLAGGIAFKRSRGSQRSVHDGV